MRLAWAVAAGLLLGIGTAWWLAREPGKAQQKEVRARQAASEQASDARPSLYRWRDDAGVLQITDKPPKGRPFERIDREPQPGIKISGERGN